MSKVLDLYERANRVPVVGRGAFSLAFALKAPYFLTIAPSVIELPYRITERALVLFMRAISPGLDPRRGGCRGGNHASRRVNDL